MKTKEQEDIDELVDLLDIKDPKEVARKNLQDEIDKKIFEALSIITEEMKNGTLPNATFHSE